MNNTERAQRVYEQLTPERNNIERTRQMYGEKWQPRAVVLATVEELAQWFATVDAINTEYGTTPNYEKCPYGDEDAVRRDAQSRARHNKRSAGARAMVKKYGYEAACRIVSEHAGRSIRLQK